MAMAVMTIAVCDEVRKDAQRLFKQLSGVVPDAEIIMYRSRESLIKSLKESYKKWDILFLGLDGEKGESLETVRAIRLRGNYMPVVLMAANNHFYKEAFEVFAFNYLIKPADCGELKHVLQPVLEECEQKRGKTLHFYYRTQVYTLQHSHVLYISSNLHNVSFHMTNGKIISCRARLTDFSSQLADSSFLRCHQSYCVNLEKVTALQKNSFMIRETEIPISRSYLKESREKYRDYLAQQKVCS